MLERRRHVRFETSPHYKVCRKREVFCTPFRLARVATRYDRKEGQSGSLRPETHLLAGKSEAANNNIISHRLLKRLLLLLR